MRSGSGRLILAEWRKTTTTKLPWVLTIIAVGYSALQAVLLILLAAPGLMSGFANTQSTDNMLMSSDYLGAALAQVGTAATFTLLLGIVAMTGEYRHMTITATYLASPRRSRVLIAKMALYALIGAAVALVTLIVVTVAMLIALLPFEHAPLTTDMWLSVLLGSVIGLVLFGVLGVSIGALIPNQVAAIVTALLWMLLLEPVLSLAFPKVGMWLPQQALQAAMDVGVRSEFTGQFVAADNLPVWGGILLLLAYAAVFGAIASRTTLSRDIT
jgi:ABC-2 type transport system permease protein